MKKYVFSMDVMDDLMNTLSDIDVCLYLNDLQMNCGKSFDTGYYMCSSSDVSSFLSDRVRDLMDDLRYLLDESYTIDENKMKVS